LDLQVYFFNQERHFSQHLRVLKEFPVMSYDKAKLKRAETAIDLPGLSMEQINPDFLFRYEVFPDNIMSHLTQWGAEQRTMEVGDTIVQQVYLPPSRVVSQKLIFGVRVNRVFKDSRRVGFSYETLVGHVERGESEFSLETVGEGLRFVIRTFSEPSSWFLKLLGPVFALPYQRFCTAQALKHVKNQIL